MPRPHISEFPLVDLTTDPQALLFESVWTISGIILLCIVKPLELLLTCDRLAPQGPVQRGAEMCPPADRTTFRREDRRCGQIHRESRPGHRG